MSIGARWSLLLIVLAYGASSCAGGVQPSDSAALRTDSTSITQPSLGNGPPHAIQVFLANTGDRAIHVRLCNLPAPNEPTAALTEQEQAPDSSWYIVLNYVTCTDPSDGFDQSVAPGTELRVARVLPGLTAGRFRYVMTYATSNGTIDAVTSAPFTVAFQ